MYCCIFLKINSSLSIMVKNTGRLETNIVSLERIKEYTEVEQEVKIVIFSFLKKCSLIMLCEKSRYINFKVIITLRRSLNYVSSINVKRPVNGL